jgi:hypothetical protein
MGTTRTTLAAVSGVAAAAAAAVAIGWATSGTVAPPAMAPTHRVAVSALPLPDSEPLARAVHCPAHPGNGTRAQLERFPAAAAVLCSPGEARYRDGLWEVVRTQVSVGSIQRLLATLDRPDIASKANEMCAAIAYAPAPLVLVAADGRTLSPHVPTDSCGAPQQAAITALHRLHLIVVAVVRKQLEQSAPALASQCDMMWKNENAMLPDSRPGARELAAGRLRVCWYAMHTDPMGGDFVHGATLGGADAARLRAALAHSGSTAECLPQSRYAVVFDRHGGYADVELGGCYRVHTSDGTGRADRAVVAALLG